MALTCCKKPIRARGFLDHADEQIESVKGIRLRRKRKPGMYQISVIEGFKKEQRAARVDESHEQRQGRMLPIAVTQPLTVLAAQGVRTHLCTMWT